MLNLVRGPPKVPTWGFRLVPLDTGRTGPIKDQPRLHPRVLTSSAAAHTQAGSALH